MTKNIAKDSVFLGWAVPTVLAAGVYLSTMCRTVYVGDSGEFSLVLKTLGIAHPPGYPLFTLAGHVFVTILSFLKPALAANLFGVLAAAAAIPALFFLVGDRSRPLLTSLLCLPWAFSPAYWGETNAVEVYAFSLALVATISALALSDNHRKWYIIAYLLGLALAHHLSALAVVPALAYLFFSQKSADRRKPFPVYLLLFALGLSLYLYLPARSSRSPLMDWGHPASLGLLYNHVTAAQYQQAASFSFSSLLDSIKLFFTLVLGNWWWIGLGVAAWGCWQGLKAWPRRTIFALILMAGNLLLAAFYRIPDIDPYYLPGLLACWILMVQGIYGLGEKIPEGVGRQVLLGSVGLAVIMLLGLNFGQINRSNHHLAYDYGKLILDSAGEGTVFTSDDNASFSALYLRYAEEYRPQVEVFDKATRAKALANEAERLSGQPAHDYWTARDLYLRSMRGNRFLVKCQFPYEARWTEGVNPLYTDGILYALLPPTSAAPIPELWQEDPPEDFKSRQILVNLELARGEDLVRRTSPDSSGARCCFQRALDNMEGEPRGTLHNQLGISFRHLGQEEFALTCYMRALEAPRLSRSERQEVIFNTSNIYKDRGNRLIKEENLTGAVEAFNKALEYDPQNAKLMYNIGLIYVQYLKQPDRGLPYLEDYLKLNPSDHEAANLVRQLKGR